MEPKQESSKNFYITSSSGKSLRNPDGTRNVFCKRCGTYVGTVSMINNFGSVSACAKCNAVDEGISLPADVIDRLTSVNIPGVGLVPTFIVNSEDHRKQEAVLTDPMSPDIEDRLGPTYWLKAVAIKAKQKLKDIIESDLPSQKLARDKRRKPIFSRSLEEELKD